MQRPRSRAARRGKMFGQHLVYESEDGSGPFPPRPFPLILPSNHGLGAMMSARSVPNLRRLLLLALVSFIAAAFMVHVVGAAPTDGRPSGRQLVRKVPTESATAPAGESPAAVSTATAPTTDAMPPGRALRVLRGHPHSLALMITAGQKTETVPLSSRSG